METTDIFLKLIKEFAKDGQISEVKMMILKEKAATLEIEDSALNMLIEMELTNQVKIPSSSVMQSEEKIKVPLAASEIGLDTTTSSDKPVSKEQANQTKIPKIHNGTWIEKTSIEGREDEFFILADDGGGAYSFSWVDKDKGKIKIKIEYADIKNIIDDNTEIISEMISIEFDKGIFYINTKAVSLILINEYLEGGKYFDEEDKEEFNNSQEQELKEGMISFFGKYVNFEESDTPKTEVKKIIDTKNGGVNKLALLEILIKECARDGKIDSEDIIEINAKAKELGISELVAKEILNGIKDKLIETKNLKLNKYFRIFDNKYFENKKNFEDLEMKRKSLRNRLSLLIGKYQVYKECSDDNWESVFDKNEAQLFAENIFGKNFNKEEVTYEEAMDLCKKIEDEYSLKKFGFLQKLKSDSLFGEEEFMKNNLPLLRKKLDIQEKEIENEIIIIEKSIASQKDIIEKMEDDKKIHIGISLATNGEEIYFYSKDEKIEFIEFKKDDILVIKTNNTLYNFELVDVNRKSLEKELIFHFGSKVK